MIPDGCEIRLLDCVFIRQLMDRLDQKEREIIELRFGFRSGRPQTLEEIARIFKITGERIRQYETRALNKMRFAVRKDGLLK